MAITLKDTNLESSSNLSISASGATYGLVIDATGRVRHPQIPAFLAYGVQNGTYATGNVWQFATEYVDIRSNYNPSNGRFTAPVAGTYAFFWSNIGANTNDVYRYYFRLNGSTLRDVHFRSDTGDSGSEYGQGGERFFMITMAASDYAEIYFTSDSSNSSYPNGNDATNNYTAFQGFLIG